jgi:hypothetical protein
MPENIATNHLHALGLRNIQKKLSDDMIAVVFKGNQRHRISFFSARMICPSVEPVITFSDKETTFSLNQILQYQHPNF